MVKRKYWQELIERLWKKRSVLWISGVRRAGKTYLCKSLKDVIYYDCELPRIRKMIEGDPESFIEGNKGKRIILDEIHRLNNPSELLKIAADYFPQVKIIATGSSTISASKKFKDTLAGRKLDIWLTPLTVNDLEDFKNNDIKHRFLFGGLPPFFMEKKIPEQEFQEWMDAYWAKDIQELFKIGNKSSFQKFFELLTIQSGGIFEATKFAAPCEVSRTTIFNYLHVLEETNAAYVIKPYSTNKSAEIVSAPKVYSFDTGFTCYYRGWNSIRESDLGILWEHYVLDNIYAALQSKKVLYWRTKNGSEIDFIIPDRIKGSIAIECKWSFSEFDPKNLLLFRRKYKKGPNFVISQDINLPFTRHYEKNVAVKFTNLKDFFKLINKSH